MAHPSWRKQVLWGFWLFAISPCALADNLSDCLDGRYPSLCNRTNLTPAQLKRINEAQHRANLQSCLDGRYPSLCDHGNLTIDEVDRVSKAEHVANLSVCLDGRYPPLCRHGDLTSGEADRVHKAEHAANLSVCLDGRYPPLCRHADLTADEQKRVGQVEAKHPQVVEQAHPPRVVRGRVRGASGCESGHWIESIMDDGNLIKLEDGTLWEVDAVDTVDSAIWLPVSDVVVCDGKIINTDDNETVHARQIR